MIKDYEAIAEANEILREALPLIGADRVKLGPCSQTGAFQLVGFRMLEGPPRAVMIHRAPSTAVEDATYDIRQAARDAVDAALHGRWVEDLNQIDRMI